MPSNRKLTKSHRLAAKKATTKYRRLQTLMNKIIQMSEKCGDMSINLLIKDKKLNKITEYHTNDEQMQLANISK